jgi:hypothetical protein
VAAGMLSASPAVPQEDLDTIGQEWLLVAQSRLPTATVADLARIIYENKTELALPDGFASRIEPAATDKDAFIVAHPGAAEYINDESKSFIERYSELIYVGLAALSIIGSIFIAINRRARRIAGRTGSCPAQRDEIGLRREHLKRHPPSQDDKVVAVKTAQSA